MNSIGASYRYRLRLLAERDRFYKLGDAGLAAMARHGFAVRTGRIDRFGRVEWRITVAGREASSGLVSACGALPKS